MRIIGRGIGMEMVRHNNNRGVGIRARGVGKFFKINKLGGRRLFGTREYGMFCFLRSKAFKIKHIPQSD